MSKLFLVTLDSTYTTPGPFNIYYDSVSTGSIVASSVTRTQLLAGYQVTVPDSTFYLYVENIALGCGNTKRLDVSDPTPTPTPTTTSTQTQTPTSTPTPSPTLTSTPTLTPTFTLTPTNTRTPTLTPTLTSTTTPTLTRTVTPTRTVTATSVAVPTYLSGSDSVIGTFYTECFANGVFTFIEGIENQTQIILLDQSYNPITASSTITITAIYNITYAGGGTGTFNQSFTINSASTGSNIYTYNSVYGYPDCNVQTISFNRILTSTPYYSPYLP